MGRAFRSAFSLAIVAAICSAGSASAQEQYAAQEWGRVIRAHDAAAFVQLLRDRKPANEELTVVAEVVIEYCDPSMMRVLLDLGLDANTGYAESETPLVKAVRTGCRELTNQLLSAGADPNRGSMASGPPLPIAVSGGNRTLIGALLMHGGNPNSRSPSFDPEGKNRPDAGPTCLMLAAGRGDKDVIDMLLKAGADPSLTDSLGRRAIDYLKEHESEVRGISRRLTPTVAKPGNRTKR